MPLNLKVLKWNALAQSIYPFVSFPLYLYLMVKFPDFYVLATLYLILIVIHEALFMLALVLLWVGYFNKSRILISISNIVLIISGAFVYYSYVLIIPFLAVNLVSIRKTSNRQTPPES